MNEVLETPYYVNDFLHVLETVEMHYGAEFNCGEKGFSAKLKALSPQALCLFIRLVNRSKAFYSLGKIDYKECHPTAETVAELIESDLVVELSADHEDVVKIMADCYTVKELAPLKSAAQLKPKTKADYISRLENSEDRDWWINQLLVPNPIIAPVREPWQFFAYLYFGEITSNLSAFVIKELGHLTPETIEPAKYERAFISRLHGEIKYRHDQCYQVFKQFRSEMTALDLYCWWKDQRLPSPIDSSTSQSHDRMVGKMGALLAKADCYDLAIATYRKCISDECALPLAKLLRKRGDKEEALAVCKKQLLNSPDPEVVQQGNLLMQRLSGKRARSSAHAALSAEPVAKLTSGESCVEYAALNHLKKEGWSGIHSENWLWCAFFGLTLWPVIYDPSYGGFNNGLQLAPSDLWRPEFFEKRREVIEIRIRGFSSKDELLATISETLDQKKNITNPFFRWKPDLEIHLSRLCNLLPLSGLKAALRRMATDPGQFLRGFPDLFVWRDPVEYSFIEVKSLNDKLSAHQLEWINTFNAFGIKTRIMRVNHSSDNRSKLKDIENVF